MCTRMYESSEEERSDLDRMLVKARKARHRQAGNSNNKNNNNNRGVSMPSIKTPYSFFFLSCLDVSSFLVLLSWTQFSISLLSSFLSFPFLSAFISTLQFILHSPSFLYSLETLTPAHWSPFLDSFAISFPLTLSLCQPLSLISFPLSSTGQFLRSFSFIFIPLPKITRPPPTKTG